MTSKSIAAISAILLGLASTPVLALDLNVGGSASGSASGSSGDSGGSASFGADISGSLSVNGRKGDDGEGSSASASATAAAAGDASASLTSDDPLLDVIALINASNWSETSLDGWAGIEGTTYNVSGWISAENSAALDATLEAHKDRIARLHAAIAANAEVSAWLASEHVNVSSVIAVGVAANGSLVVFTN